MIRLIEPTSFRPSAHLLAAFVRTIILCLFIISLIFSELSIVQSAAAETNWRNVRSQDDFLNEYVVKHPIAKKLITDRYVNFFHDRFGNTIADRVDIGFSPTDWMQAIDHAANGEFKKLELFAAEAIGKKIVEAIFPVGGTILTQAYDYAKMVSGEVQAWGSKKDVHACLKGFFSQYGDVFRKTTDHRKLNTAYLNKLFDQEWGESRELFGWAQWTILRKNYWERQLKVQCWQAVMNVAVKHRKRLRQLEQVKATARAEKVKFAKITNEVYAQLNKVAKVLYYAGEIGSIDVDQHASKIQQFLNRDRAGRDIYIKKAKEGYARTMGEAAINKVEKMATEFERHYNAYERANAVNRLLDIREPDYRQFYANYKFVTKKFLSGRMRIDVYNDFKYRNMQAFKTVSLYVGWTVEQARGLIKEVGVSREAEKRAEKKAGKLMSDLWQHNQKLSELRQKLDEKIAALAKEKFAEYERIIKTNSGGNQVEKTVGRASNAASSPSVASVASIKLVAGQTVDHLPPPSGDVTQYTHDIETAYTALDRNIGAKIAGKVASIKKGLPGPEKNVQELIQQAEALEDWVHANQHFVDFFGTYNGAQFENPAVWRMRVISAGYNIEKQKISQVNDAEKAEGQQWDTQNQQARAAYTFNEVRTRVGKAREISNEASRLLGKYKRLDFDLAAAVPGILRKQDAEGIISQLKEHPKGIMLADLDFALSHFNHVRRDLGRANYSKVLDKDYIAKNNPGKVFHQKMPDYVNRYLQWSHRPDFLKWLQSVQPRFRQVLQAINHIPQADLDGIEAAHAKALALQKHANAASLQKWEDAVIADAVSATEPANTLKEKFAWVRLANKRLKAAIVAHERAQAYILKHEPVDRKLVVGLFDKAEKLRGSNPAAALAIVEQANNRLKFVLTFMPYILVGHNDLAVHGQAQAAVLKKEINKTSDDVYDFPESGNYHVTINGVSSRTMRRYEANKIASGDGLIEIRTESFDPVFRNAEKIMIYLYSGQRLRRPVFTTVARNRSDFVHKLKVPYGKPHTLEVRIVSDKLVGYSPVQYPLNFHWGKMPTVSTGNVKTIRVRNKGDVVTLTGRLNEALELKFTRGNANSPAELQVLRLYEQSLYGLQPWGYFAMLHGKWTGLTPYTTHPESSRKFRHYSTEEEDKKGIQLWEFQTYIESGEQYNVYRKSGKSWQLTAYIIGMDVNKPKPPGKGGKQIDQEPETAGYDKAIVMACGSADDFVKSLYHSAFEREPASSEVQVHVKRLQSGILRAQTVGDFLLSAEYEGLTKGGEDFIKDAYQLIYGRQATLSEHKAWPRTRRLNIISMMLKGREHLELTSGCSNLWRKSKSGDTPPKSDTDDHVLSKLELWEKYTSAYKKLTGLMAEGKGNTAEAQEAYKKFKHFKELFEKAKGSGGGQPVIGTKYKFEKANYWHHQFKIIKNHTSMQACARSCDLNSSCAVASYHDNTATGGWANTCVLRKKVGPRHTEQKGIYSWIKKSAGDPALTGSNNVVGGKTNADVPGGGTVGGTVRLGAVADSHVYAYSYRNWNRSNLGKYNILGTGWHPSGGEKRAYLKFDLTGINVNSFGKATLKLHHYHTGGGNAVALGVHRVTEPWAEGSDTYHSGQAEKTAPAGEITWVNQPSFDPTPVLGFNPGTNSNKSIELDITPLVKRWLEGVPNYGLVIKSQGPLQGKPAAQYGFHAREHKDIDTRPVLLLTGGTAGGDVIDPPGGNSTGSNNSAFGSGNYISDGFHGNIYYLAKGTSHLPDFSTMQPAGSIYSRSIDIPNQSFTKGFPGVTDRFEWFGIRYTASFRVGRPGAYRFRTYSDDGSKLWVDSKLIINNDGTHPARSVTGKIQLDPGIHTIQLDYFQGPRTMVALRLFLTPPGGVEAIFDGVFQSTAPVSGRPPYGDLSGKWLIHQRNGFSGVLDLTQNAKGQLSGTALWSAAENGPVTGKLVGDVIEFTIHYSWGQGVYKGTLAPGGTRMINGNSKSSTGDFASWTATLQLSSPPPRDTDDPPVDADNKVDSLDKKTAYQQYIAAYNKLTSLMAKGDGESRAAQRAYQEYKKAKEVYEAVLK